MISVNWIIEFIATFCEAFLCVVFCGTFIPEPNHKELKIIIPALLTMIILFINSINLYSPLTTEFTVIMYIISIMIIYHKNKLKSLSLSVLYLLILTIIDNIVVSSISFFLDIPTTEIYQEMSGIRCIAIIASKSLLVIFTTFINKISSGKKNIQKKYIIALFFVTIIMFILVSALAFIDIKNNSVNSYVSVIFFIIMLLLTMTIFLGAFRLTDYYENQRQLNLMELKNSMLEQSMNDTRHSFELIRTSLHDYKHNIINLMTLARSDDMDGIIDYLEKENSLLSETLFYYMTGNETVDAILYIKQKIAESQGITFMINAKVTERCPVTSEHFASILGNLLDNAIEACVSEENPFIEVKIHETEEYFWIIVVNKCTNPDISLNTSKKNKYLHGIGLNSVRHTVKSYHGDIDITTDNQKFDIRIMIPLNENPV
ncbi:MAG: GHKL domain-containing protein [Ruminococcus sp.]|nr:GHKL domain-containing protein [Ruminococcus sp.]